MFVDPLVDSFQWLIRQRLREHVNMYFLFEDPLVDRFQWLVHKLDGENRYNIDKYGRYINVNKHQAKYM